MRPLLLGWWYTPFWFSCYFSFWYVTKMASVIGASQIGASFFTKIVHSIVHSISNFVSYDYFTLLSCRFVLFASSVSIYTGSIDVLRVETSYEWRDVYPHLTSDLGSCAYFSWTPCCQLWLGVKYCPDGTTTNIRLAWSLEVFIRLMDRLSEDIISCCSSQLYSCNILSDSQPIMADIPTGCEECLLLFLYGDLEEIYMKQPPQNVA